MSTSLAGLPPVLYLGNRSYSSFDFDGRVRQCNLIKVTFLAPRAGPIPDLIIVKVDPALPGYRGGLDRVVLRSSTDVSIAEVETLFPLDVDLYRSDQLDILTSAEVEPGRLNYVASGIVAPLPELLPLTPDRLYYEMLGLLYALQTKTGTTDVPLDFRMNNQPLGRWIRQVRQQHRNAVHYPDKIDDLPRDWRDQLESLTDWTWELEQGPE